MVDLSLYAKQAAGLADRHLGRVPAVLKRVHSGWLDPATGALTAGYEVDHGLMAVVSQAVVEETAAQGGQVSAEDVGLMVWAADLEVMPDPALDQVILAGQRYRLVRVGKIGPGEPLLYKLQLRRAGPAVFYVDSDKGEDENDGRTPPTAWKSLGRVMKGSYLPGDSILLAKGRIFRGQIQIGSSGAAGRPLVLGAYDPPDGAVTPPSLRGSDNVSSANLWRNGGGNLWYLSEMAQDPVVFGHGGVLGRRCPELAALAETWDYFYDQTSQRLYVYALDNPGNLGEALEAAVRDYVLGPTWTEQIRVEGLDLRHGRVETWIGWGGGHYEFKNCLFTQSGGQHLQAHNGFDSLAVLSCDFDDWNVGDGQCYAVHAIAGAGPVDVESCSFRATRPTTFWDHTAVMSDTQGWVRTVKKCSFQGFAGDGVVVWRPREDADLILLEDLSFQDVGGNNVTLQELEHHGATPTVRVRRVPIKNACWRDGLDNHALRLRSISAACDLQLEYVAVDGTAVGSNWHPGVQLMNVAGARLYNFTLAGVDDGIEVLEASQIWDDLNSQWVSGVAVSGLTVLNTILADNRGYGVKAGNSGWFSQFDFNCLFSNALGDYLNVSAGEHDLLSDPLFSGAGLTLQSTSPCRGAGKPLGLTKDVTWAALPDGAPDLGAYQAA